jgi:hypothetical protein
MQVLDDVMPVIGLIDPAQNEHHFPRQEVAWSVSTSTSAVAGQFGQLTISAQPGWLVVVETLSMGGASAATSILARVGSLAGAAEPASVPSTLDTRSIAVPGLLFDASTNAVAPSTVGEVGRWYLPILGPSATYMSGEAAVVLFCEGTTKNPVTGSFTVRGATAQVGFNIILTGYSRPLDAGETGL